MADLFTLEQLVSFMQVPEFDTVTLELARELTTIAIREEVGPVTYDALTDLSPFKPIALAVAKRLVSNPDGLRSEQIDDYSRTFASETLVGADLTESEKARIAVILGRPDGAFTIRALAEPFCPETAAPCQAL